MVPAQRKTFDLAILSNIWPYSLYRYWHNRSIVKACCGVIIMSKWYKVFQISVLALAMVFLVL
jgi:hypothetical protein